jgi:hypothetical protein
MRIIRGSCPFNSMPFRNTRHRGARQVVALVADGQHSGRDGVDKTLKPGNFTDPCFHATTPGSGGFRDSTAEDFAPVTTLCTGVPAVEPRLDATAMIAAMPTPGVGSFGTRPQGHRLSGGTRERAHDAFGLRVRATRRIDRMVTMMDQGAERPVSRRAALTVALASFAAPGWGGALPDLITNAKGSVCAVGTFSALDSPRFGFRGSGFFVGDGSIVATCWHVLPDAGLRVEPGVTSLAVQLTAPTVRLNCARPSCSVSHRQHDLALLGSKGGAAHPWRCRTLPPCVKAWTWP